MTDLLGGIASPALTGGKGIHFEERVAASFVSLMLAGGYVPGISNVAIVKVKVQGKSRGYETDDVIVYCEHSTTKRKRKLIGQAKLGIAFTKGNPEFKETIVRAWQDFNNSKVFSKGRHADIIALITGPISATDRNSIRPLLDHVRACESAEEFFTNMRLGKLFGVDIHKKLEVFRKHLDFANKCKVGDKEVYEFLCHFHVLCYDLDIRTGVNQAFLDTVIYNATGIDPTGIWGRICQEVAQANQNAGTLSKETLPEDLVSQFHRTLIEKPDQNVTAREDLAAVLMTDWSKTDYANSLWVACVVGGWIEGCAKDMEVIGNLLGDINQIVPWQSRMRELLRLENSPLKQNGQVWELVDPSSIWENLASRISDSDLSRIEVLSIQVLSQKSSSFEEGGVPNYDSNAVAGGNATSRVLFNGFVQTIAYMGNFSSAFLKCTSGFARTIAQRVVRSILYKKDAESWASLSSNLPTLSEAAPDEYLEAVRSSFLRENSSIVSAVQKVA